MGGQATRAKIHPSNRPQVPRILQDPKEPVGQTGSMVGFPLPFQFHHHIMHVDGVDNKVADCLSRYYENDTGNESHPEHIYLNADARLDPDGELLPTDRYMEPKTAATRRSNRLAEKRKPGL
jgi:hypothetical protein